MSTSGRSPACRRSPRGNFWRSNYCSVMLGHDEHWSPRVQPLTLHADIHLAFDIAPFLGGAQRADQFLERIRIGGGLLEASEGNAGDGAGPGVIKVAGEPPVKIQIGAKVVGLWPQNFPPV